MLRRATLACTPPTAHPEVLALAHHVTSRLPGEGAVRELCDLLLVASGHYARELEAAAS
jgi:3-deoxy-D-manno-octulosonate 8-phosphate phosphatase (KDO 8-P phosphatase)